MYVHTYFMRSQLCGLFTGINKYYTLPGKDIHIFKSTESNDGNKEITLLSVSTYQLGVYCYLWFCVPQMDESCGLCQDCLYVRMKRIVSIGILSQRVSVDSFICITRVLNDRIRGNSTLTSPGVRACLAPYQSNVF